LPDGGRSVFQQNEILMKVTEAIILAGGLGTRLRESVPDLPKCMAPVAGRPFLSYVIDSLRMQGIERFIFSLGYKAGIITEYLKKEYPTLQYVNFIEEEPLGTGGAVKGCIDKVTTENFIVANGDTLFRIDLNAMITVHENNAAETTLALKFMKDFNRYGVVKMDGPGLIESFHEKQFYSEGLINGGIYLVNRSRFVARDLPLKFSFEKDYLEKFAGEKIFSGSTQEGYFIDIGIPGDFEKAQSDLVKAELDLNKIDKAWTLFLDRDGVINNERLGEYVLHWEQFIFSEGVLESFRLLSEHFGRIFIISNQRGVGKGLMTEGDLNAIHKEMQKEVEAAGGHIDKIYYCTEKDDHNFFRKPNPGMAYKAKTDFPDIDLTKAIMVGNKPSDMKFGRAAGVFTVFLRTTNPDQPYPHKDIDLVFPSLQDFARAL
jgi:D-glycero-alpha-D-manno-heptose 1-phosphate guanylyltransferase